MYLINIKNISKQKGATLIEILIAVIITAIGLLGTAAMQNTSMKLSYDSYIRSQASFLAYDLIDRARANPNSGPYTLNEDDNPPKTDCFADDDCNSGKIRSFDLHYWKKQATQLLPDAKVSVTYDAANSLYSMKIRWDDRVDNDVKQDESKEFIYHFKVNN